MRYLRDYVPGDDAARERERLRTVLATQVLPAAAVLFALLVVAFLPFISSPYRTIDLQLATCADRREAVAAFESVHLVRLSPTLAVVDGWAVALDSARLDGAPLGPVLRRFYESRPDKVLVLHVTGAGSYQQLFDIMDAARGAGVKVLGVLAGPCAAWEEPRTPLCACPLAIERPMPIL